MTNVEHLAAAPVKELNLPVESEIFLEKQDLSVTSAGTIEENLGLSLSDKITSMNLPVAAKIVQELKMLQG